MLFSPPFRQTASSSQMIKGYQTYLLSPKLNNIGIII